MTSGTKGLGVKGAGTGISKGGFMVSFKRRPTRVGLIAASVLVLVLGVAAVALADDFRGTTGPDTINATDGDDTITSGRGNDTVNAGWGNDVVTAGPGADTVDAGTFSVDQPGLVCESSRPEGNDTVNGGGGQDMLAGGDQCGESGGINPGDSDTLNGQGANDTIDVDDQADDGTDTANGGRGNDACIGNADDVFLSCETVLIN